MKMQLGYVKKSRCMLRPEKTNRAFQSRVNSQSESISVTIASFDYLMPIDLWFGTGACKAFSAILTRLLGVLLGTYLDMDFWQDWSCVAFPSTNDACKRAYVRCASLKRRSSSSSWGQWSRCFPALQCSKSLKCRLSERIYVTQLIHNSNMLFQWCIWP